MVTWCENIGDLANARGKSPLMIYAAYGTKYEPAAALKYLDDIAKRFSRRCLLKWICFAVSLDKHCRAGNMQFIDGQSSDGHGGDERRFVTAETNRNSIPAACIACRTKHLKCDGQIPCSRCAAMGLSAASCMYVRSRRGYKGPRRNKNQIPQVTGECHNLDWLMWLTIK